MEMLHVLGNTYAAVGSTALLPIYKLNERDIVLIDTGYAKLDRAGLVNLLDGSGLVPKYVLCSHAHFDHTGNVRYLQERYGAKAILSLIEAGISVNPDSYRANYVALTYGKSRELFLEECFTADRVLRETDTSLELDGPLGRALGLRDAGRRGLCGGLSHQSERDRRGEAAHQYVHRQGSGEQSVPEDHGLPRLHSGTQGGGAAGGAGGPHRPQHRLYTAQAGGAAGSAGGRDDVFGVDRGVLPAGERADAQ